MTPHPFAPVIAALERAPAGSRELDRIVPVIGLWQPYASLVAIGAKPWETRHFSPPARLLGKRVAIQATLRRPTRDEVRYNLPRQIKAALGRGWECRVPYGAVVCTAILAIGFQVRQMFDNGDVRLSDGRVIPDDGFGDYSVGRWCWKLEGVHQLARPIPLKGRQDIGWAWTPDDAQRAALRARALPPQEPASSEGGA